jgi:CDP-diacylglycerol---serine O-phosphatidyltransferase
MSETPGESSLKNGKEQSAGRRRLGRSVYLLPSLLTVGNIFCGYYAILMTISNQFDTAAKAIGIAIVLDMLDGRIARLTNSTSDFGLQLDSLADVISFGIAPSILALFWGLSPVEPRLAYIAAFTFAICGAMRLARFNVQAGTFKHFVGMPIPAGGGAVAAVVHFFGPPIANKTGGNLMLAAVFMLALLMISTMKYSSLKYLTLGKKSHLTILVIALLVALCVFLSKQTFLALATLYVISGPIARISAFLHRKRNGEEMTLANSTQQR